MKKIMTKMLAYWVILGLAAFGVGDPAAQAQELLTNGGLEESATLPGWMLEESAADPQFNPQNTAELIGFAAHTGATGLWLREFEGLFFGSLNERTHAVLSQTVTGMAGETYTFTGWSRWETNYSGGVTTLDPGSPSGAVPSPTDTLMELAFLDGGGDGIGNMVLDLRIEQMNGAGWRQHTLMGTAPGGTASVRVSASAIDMIPNVDPGQSAFFDDFSLRGASAPLLERLLAPGLEVPPIVGWTLTESPAGTDSAETVNFRPHTGEAELFLKAFAGGTAEHPESADAVLSQTVPGTAGDTFSFSAWSRWEVNYSGGVTTLDPSSPSGAIPSPTQTLMELAFLNSGGSVIGSPRVLDLRTEQMNDDDWRPHELIGVAPAGTTSVRVTASGLDMLFNVDPAQSAFFDDFSLMRLDLVEGDLDCDSDVDFDDIDDFVLGLNNPTLYESNFGLPPAAKGDTDNDGDLDFDDIAGFVAILSGGGVQTAVPEPSTIGLVGSAAIVALFGLGSVTRRRLFRRG